MKKNKTYPYVGSFGRLDTQTPLEIERFELDPEEISAFEETVESSDPKPVETIDEASPAPVGKSHFWESLVHRAKPVKESLPEMIEELQPKVNPTTDYPVKPMSVINQGMIIHGDLHIEGPLTIEGTVFGRIVSTDSIDSKSGNRIHGDVSAQSIFLVGGTLTGDVLVQDKATIDAGSVVFGDIKAQSMVISGKVEGNLKASGNIHLGASAIVTGDLSASSFSVDEGALLLGHCQIAKPDFTSVRVDHFEPTLNF